MATIQERLNKMKNSGPAISSNVREFQDTRTEEEKRAVNQAARDRASGKVISSLENQRRQAQVDMDIDTMNALDARMKAIRASAGQQTFADRADENFSGWAKNTAAAYAKAGKDILGFLNDVNNAASAERRENQQEAKNRAHYEEILARGTWDTGERLTDADRAQLTNLIGKSDARIKANNDYLSAVNAPVASLQQKVGAFGDRNAQEAAVHNEAARNGATALEKVLLDTGNVAGDVVSDFALNAMAPGLGTASRVTRMYGSGSRAAEEKGLGSLGQFGYGATKAALGEATNRLFSGNPILEKATGKGALDDLLFPGLERTLPGAMFKGGFGEAVEETAENLADIPIQKIFFGDKADQVSAKDIGYDALIASIIGGITGISGKKSVDTRDGEGSALISQNTHAGDMTVDAEGNYMGAAENAVQGVSGGVMEQEAQRLFGNNNPPAQGTGYAATEMGRPDTPLGVSATQEDTTSVSPSAGNASKNMDPLLKMLTGGKRVDQTKLTNEQFSALADRSDIGMDAGGKVYQVDPAQHIDRRTADSVSSRNMNAFQFDHPELHSYYQQAAEALIADADLSLQFPMSRSYERTMQGNKVNQSVQASAHLRQAMDETGLSRAEIIDAAQRIVHDQGQENVKAAKQVEIILDSMLTNGWSTMMGDTVGPNQAYIDAKSGIAGSQADSLGHGLDDIPVGDGLGNANAGTVNTAFDDMQARSDNFHPVNPNSEQRIMNDQQRAPSEVPTVNPDTGKNIEKTVSTILNSPLTSPEMATQIESAVADGQFDYIPVTDRGANLKAQQDLSNRGLQSVADSFIAKVELGQRITKNDTASAIAAYNQAVADGNHALAFDLMTAIADAAHDSAQVVQSMNLMNRLTPEGRLLTLRKYVDKLNRQQNSKPGRQAATANATQEQVDAARTNYVEQATGFRISDELAANYLMAETDAERAAAWDAITTDIANQIPGTFREKANFWRYTSMLLNPTTHVRNFMGNAIQAGARTIKNGVGAVIERAVVKDASQRTKSVVLGKEGKALRDFAKSQYEADKSAAMGAGKYSDASAAGINREIQDKHKAYQGSNPLSKAVQAVGDFNTRLLDLGDVIFNKSAYVDSFAQALKAKGVTAAEAAGGSKSDLVAQARAYAIEEAQKATYRNTTALSEALSKMGRYEGDNAFLKAMSVAADAFMPFRRTPANILTTGMDYSPIGIAKALKEGLVDVQNGNCTAADVVDSLSAGLTGTGILAMGAYLAAEGLLKVRTGEDDREKDYNQDRGMQDYSLQIGDKSYTLDWAVPAAMPLFAGAAIMESAGEGGSGFDAVMDAIGGISEVVLETSMLSSLNDLISNWSYADNKGLYLLDRTATSYAGQYVPTVGGKIASAMDETVRKSYVEKGTGQLASDLGYFAQSMEKKIPGARENLQPKVDLWGNEVSNGEVGDRLLQSFLSPGYFKTVDTSALDKELRRLAEATGSSAVYPAEVEKSFKVGGETKNLTAEEYTKYAKAVGQARYQAVSALTGNSGYKKLTDEEKAKAVAYAYEYATVKGKQAVSSYKPGDSSFAKGAMNSVLPIDSYILYKINADMDDNGSVSGTESARTLQGLSGLTDKQRGQEWAKRNSGTSEAKNPFIGALPKSGISVDTSIKIYEKYRSLSNADGMKPKEKGAQLRAYVNSLGLTAAQMKAVKDTYSMYGSYYVDW